MERSDNADERFAVGYFCFVPRAERANVNTVVRQLWGKYDSLTGEKRIMLVKETKRAALARWDTFPNELRYSIIEKRFCILLCTMLIAGRFINEIIK